MKSLSLQSIRLVLVTLSFSLSFSLSILLSLLGAATPEAFAGLTDNWVCTLNGKAVSLSNGGTTAGQTGIMKCVDKTQNNLLVHEQEYRDGKTVGHQMNRSYDDGTVTVRSVDEQNRIQGTEKKYNKGGKMISEAGYKDGEHLGLAKKYFDDGKPKQVEWWKEDNHSIPAFNVEYLPDGKITRIWCSKKGGASFDLEKQLCGYEGKPSKIQLFTSQGKNDQSIVFQNGQRRETTDFDSGGKVERREVSAGDSKKVTELYPDGKLKVEAEYQGKVLHGTQKEYHSSGKLVRKTTWEKGRMTSEEEYYLNGSVKSRAQQRKDRDTWLVARQNYSDNGQLIEDGVFAEKTAESAWMGFELERWTYSVPVGLHRQLTEQGVLVLSEPYDRDGNLQGVSKTYFPDSKPRSEAGYEKGVLKWRKTWDRSGQLVEDDEFFEDGSRANRLKKPKQGA